MSDKIQLLSEVVANQIAAGEVVDRPASVVKEMMENAIDAGAHAVKVNFRDGGRDLIQIIDDGCGMSPIDARMAFDRHATSKISSLDDIYSLHTFGFRGEALASIGAVAQVELRTRQQGDELGTETTIHGGTFVAQKPVMCAVGSQFFVRNLFYNVPARRRFLDKTTTSATHIKTEFQRVALCYPQVSFELYCNDAPIYNLIATSLAGRIVDVVGRHIKQNLLEVSASTSIASIEGFIGRPVAAKKRNSEQFLFINGRYFNSGYLYKAILKGYEKLIPESCAPSYFLYLKIDPARIDVNVHPQKTQVKFADEEAVWQIVNAAVRETLGKTGAVPMMDFDEQGGVDIPVLRRGAVYSEPRAMSDRDYNPFNETYIDHSAPMPDVDFAGFDVPYNGDTLQSTTPSTLNDSELEFIPSTSEEAVQQQLHEQPAAAFSDVVSLGGGYASALFGGRFVVVDLRRACERVLYENYRVMLGNGSSVSQQLLFPERLVLSSDEYALMEENAVEFAELGFDVDYCGEGAIEVKGTPADMPADTIDELIYELLQAFDTPQTLVEVRRDKIALVMARGGSRTAPRRTNLEAAALLAQLVESANFSFSPSGKAIMIEITPEDIRAKLG
ncbi:MAG: DNA mismatch repair endonuclease MutL [Alistipes sp.]